MIKLGLGGMAHTCNPSYSEGSNQEDGSLRAAQPGGVVHAFGPSYLGGIGRKITVQGWPQAKGKLLIDKKAGGEYSTCLTSAKPYSKPYNWCPHKKNNE
jgi:hypothetical protein